ncbi:putative 3-deoxy-manno-octulosonate-8-phosphatase [Acinetobacter baumannii 653020]|nr:putative 3-deoxy-manno-octulosonate-8-phosphatase [Acinetobacter baumannii 653020]
MASYALLEQARHLQALVLDVDGILSDGFVTLTNTGDEIKSFDIRDGLGMKLAQQAGMKVIIITGRKSNIVEKRMSDLGVDLVFQGREDKGSALRKRVHSLIFCLQTAYIWVMIGRISQHLPLPE